MPGSTGNIGIWITAKPKLNGMLEKSARFVLGSSKSSTYPKGYASGFDSPAALLDELFEHPEACSPLAPYVRGQKKF
mgnify:CR=1 FL=1